MTLGGSAANTPRSCAEHAVLALGVAEVAGLERARDPEAHERHRRADAALDLLAARPLHELGGILAGWQRHHAQLELALRRDLGRPQHRLLAGAVGVQRELDHRGQPGQAGDLLGRQRGAHDADAVAHPDLVHRDDVGVALGDDDAAGLRRRRPREVGREELAALVEEVSTPGC